MGQLDGDFGLGILSRLDYSPDPMTSELYLITPPAFDPDAFADAFKAALGAGPVACVQLRLKDVADADVLRAAETLMPIAHAADVAFLINDRADLAAEIGADGVHLGQEDGSVAAARSLLGHEAQIGVTCHNSKHLAFEAGEAGADYVAFGAFFPTRTKAVKFQAEPQLIEDWALISELPCVAIGGITADNCAELVRAGADFLAASAAVWAHEDGPGAGVRALREAIDRAAA